jgi:hypothetical protein
MTEMRGNAREWRLYIVAVVAGVYVLAWSQITPKLVGEQPRSVASPSTVWLDELPRARHPALTPPTGWRVADRATEVVPPIPRRVPSSHPPRIRTRSS